MSIHVLLFPSTLPCSKVGLDLGVEQTAKGLWSLVNCVPGTETQNILERERERERKNMEKRCWMDRYMVDG